MTAGQGVLLGFDYGTKRIGVAVGQSLTGTARALETVAVRRGRPDWEVIARLLETWRPNRLVVGLPLNMDGGEQALSVAARRFCRQLEGRFHLPVDTMDERLSTFEARQRIATGEDPGEGLDAMAAQVILESWLVQTGNP